MEGDCVFVNDHEFRFTLAATQGDGWTMSVVHIDRSGPSPVELRHAIDIEFQSELEALQCAKLVATGIAKQSDQTRSMPTEPKFLTTGAK